MDHDNRSAHHGGVSAGAAGGEPRSAGAGLVGAGMPETGKIPGMPLHRGTTAMCNFSDLSMISH